MQNQDSNPAVKVAIITGVFGLAAILLSQSFAEKNTPPLEQKEKQTPMVGSQNHEISTTPGTNSFNPEKTGRKKQVPLIIPASKPDIDPRPPFPEKKVTEISGVVTDTSGEPLQGVEVIVKSQKATTDKSGSFKIEIEFSSDTEIAYIAYFKPGYISTKCTVRPYEYQKSQILKESSHF